MFSFRKRKTRLIPAIVISMLVVSSVAVVMLINKPDPAIYSSLSQPAGTRQGLNNLHLAPNLSEMTAQALRLPPLEEYEAQDLSLEGNLFLDEESVVRPGVIYQQDC